MNKGIRNKYEKELSEIYEDLLLLCRKVEIALEDSIDALLTRDLDKSRFIIENDREVDLLERKIEENTLRILLLEHPVARDFRDVSAILKMITDLERIGDHASDISEISIHIGNSELVTSIDVLNKMEKTAILMVKDGVQSYINRDFDLAGSLDKRDDVLDNYFIEIQDELVKLIQKDSDNASQAILILMIAKYLERVGDHAVNIGEWVEYAITGYHKVG